MKEKCRSTDFTLKFPISQPPLHTHNSSKLSPIKQVSESLRSAMSNAVSSLSKTMQHKSPTKSMGVFDNIVVERSESGDRSEVDQDSIERDQVDQFEKDQYVDILD